MRPRRSPRSRPHALLAALVLLGGLAPGCGPGQEPGSAADPGLETASREAESRASRKAQPRKSARRKTSRKTARKRPGKKARGKRPNVLFVLADDLGYGDVGVYGSRDIATPRLDALAGGGARFSDFYVGTSVCSPSRYTLLTGRYPLRMDFPRGVFFPDSFGGMDPAELTIAEVLKSEGYATALIGKWHLGHLPAFLPGAQGFDLHYGLPYSNDMQAPHHPGLPPPVDPPLTCIVDPRCRPQVPLIENGVVLEQPVIQETLTRRYTERAIRFLRETVAAERPFFLFYASHVPHTPLYASSEFLGTSAGGLYGDVVEELDWSVGRLLDELDALGVARDTLVVFTSDNGPWLLWAGNGHDQPQGGNESGSAGPLRLGKGSTFEGGMRVPLIVRWPDVVPAGRIVSSPASMADWMPTIAELAGARLPRDLGLDGESLLPLLRGRERARPSAYLMTRPFAPEIGAYREGRYKLKLAVTGGEAIYARYDHGDLLFDLEQDPGEQHDLASRQPEQVAAMKQRMRELLEARPRPETRQKSRKKRKKKRAESVVSLRP